MSLGLILVDDVVDVYVLDRKLQPTEETTLHRETLQEMEVKMYTNYQGNADWESIFDNREIARRLSLIRQEYPVVLA